MKEIIEQEQHCLNVKMLCDYLRTEIFMIDDFPNRELYFKQLKKIKTKAQEKYWSI